MLYLLAGILEVMRRRRSSKKIIIGAEMQLLITERAVKQEAGVN